jgi:hypothetical protein
VLDNLSGHTWHFCQTPLKYVLAASEEVDELTFLFGVYVGPNLNGLGGVCDIDLHGLGILSRFEGAG